MLFDPLDQLRVANVILGHGATPAFDFGKHRRFSRADEFAQFFRRDLFELFVGQVIQPRLAGPADKYADLTEDFQGLNVGSMHLITSADEDEERIYQITKTIWEHRGEIASKHPAGKAINEKNAPRYTGTEFHPGAIRFYKEIEIWPEDQGQQKDSEQTDGTAEKAKDAESDTDKPDKAN